MSKHSKLQYFVIIVDQKHRKKITSLIMENGGHEVDIVYGKGSVNVGIIAEAFGLEVEENKVILSCLMKTENASILMKKLYDDYDFSKPNTGIAFSVPVDGLSF